MTATATSVTDSGALPNLRNDGPAPASSPTTPSLTSLTLPFSSQPDLVLSFEKDFYYTKQLHQQLQELAEVVLGPRKAESLGPEVQSLGDLLYYGLTVFAGMETLGQEYCSLMLVEEKAEGTFVSLSSLRRGLMVAWTVLFNYISERILHRDGWQGDYNQLIRPRGRSSIDQYNGPVHARSPLPYLQATSSAPSSPPLSPTREDPPLDQDGELEEQEEEGGENEYAYHSTTASQSSRARSPPPPFSPFPSHRYAGDNRYPAGNNVSLYARIRALVDRMTSSVSDWAEDHEDSLQHILPESREIALRMMQRLHLMMFFFTGRYYSLAMITGESKEDDVYPAVLFPSHAIGESTDNAYPYYSLAMRLARARTMFIRQLGTNERRASYVIIGAFILLETALKASSAAAQVTKTLLQGRGKEEEAWGEQRAAGDESRVPSGLGRGRTASIVSEGGATGLDDWRKCPLCMGKRKYPAATPCGHVFCWDCLLNWCSEHQECPMCRARVAPQAILHIPNLGINHKE